MYPQENEARGILSLDGLWNFKLDDGTAFENGWEKGLPGEIERLYVPASYNDQKEDAKFRSHVGWAFYERTFTVPGFYKGQRLVLRLDAVTHDAKVWLDGKLICEHKGGFLPFEVEITDLVVPGQEARITVAADNTINHSSLPIGNEAGTAFFGSDNAQVPSVQAAKIWRGKQNLPNFDFFNYAGIQRHVRIYTTPVDHIEDITIVPEVSGKDGIVNYQVKTSNGTDAELTVKVTILDKEGNCVAEGEGAEGKLVIKDAQLWNPYPETPYLYRAKVTYGDDTYTERFGIRTVEVQGTKFLINGKPFYFKGFGKHEDFYIHGRGSDHCLNVKDVGLLHWIGANSFRTSHYPYAEEMYQLCDEEGIVIIDEPAAVGIGGGNCDPYKTFPIKEYHEQVLKDMIARDKNHPSVIMWSLGNEPDLENYPESAYEYWHRLYDMVHQVDPQNRPVTLVCCQNDYTRDITTRSMDVVCINRYYGWYNLSGDIDAACYAWNLELDFWEEIGKPVMVSEYGGDTISGLHGTVGEMFTEEFQAAYYMRIDAEFDKRDFFIGEHCWAFADFGTMQGTMRADGNRKGLFSRERRPKLAAHKLRERWNAIPNFGYKS